MVVCGGDVGGVDATGAVAGAVAVAVDTLFPRLSPVTLTHQDMRIN